MRHNSGGLVQRILLLALLVAACAGCETPMVLERTVQQGSARPDTQSGARVNGAPVTRSSRLLLEYGDVIEVDETSTAVVRVQDEGKDVELVVWPKSTLVAGSFECSKKGAASSIWVYCDLLVKVFSGTFSVATAAGLVSTGPNTFCLRSDPDGELTIIALQDTVYLRRMINDRDGVSYRVLAGEKVTLPKTRTQSLVAEAELLELRQKIEPTDRARALSGKRGVDAIDALIDGLKNRGAVAGETRLREDGGEHTLGGAGYKELAKEESAGQERSNVERTANADAKTSASILPDVIKRPQKEAEETLVAAGFVVGVVKDQIDQSEKPGTVMSQQPAAGSKAGAGTYVDLIIAVLPVPDVTNRVLSEAAALLRGKGFSTGVVKVQAELMARAGTVLHQHPRGGVGAKPGTKVKLTVAMPSGNQALDVPRVIERPYNEAKEILERVGFKADVVQHRLGSMANGGQVVDQEPAAGSRVERGAKIELLITPLVVPNLTKQSLSRAMAALRKEGFRTIIVEAKIESKATAGTVFNQWPPPEAKAELGTAVRLAVAKLPDKEVRFVPDVTARSYKDAEGLLERSGFRVGVIEHQFQQAVSLGTVIDQQPVTGSNAELGTSVDLTVAIPSDRKLIEVPDVTNRPQEEAERILRSAGFYVVNDRTQFDLVGKRGRVIDQKPAPGSKVERGTKIQLVVAVSK